MGPDLGFRVEHGGQQVIEETSVKACSYRFTVRLHSRKGLGRRGSFWAGSCGDSRAARPQTLTARSGEVVRFCRRRSEALKHRCVLFFLRRGPGRSIARSLTTAGLQAPRDNKKWLAYCMGS